MVISLSSISLCHFYFHRTCYLLTDVHCRGKPGYHKSIHMEILPFEPFLYSILPCCWWLIFSSRLNFIFVTGRRGRDRILCSLESEEFFWVVFVALFNTRTRAGGWHEWLTGQDLSIWQGLSQTDAHIGALWGSTALIPSCLLRNVHGRFSRHIC